MNTLKFKSDVAAAISQVAKAHGVTVKVNRIQKGDKGLTSVLSITENVDEMTSPSTRSNRKGKSRRDQVKQMLNKGVTSAKKIATKINTHPSYVSRLISEINKEQDALATA